MRKSSLGTAIAAAFAARVVASPVVAAEFCDGKTVFLQIGTSTAGMASADGK